jgi:hypothetical protein
VGLPSLTLDAWLVASRTSESAILCGRQAEVGRLSWLMNSRTIYSNLLLKRLHRVICLAIGCGTALGLIVSFAACGREKETAASDTSASQAKASEISQARLATAFNASSENLFEAKTGSDLMKCRMLQQCELVAAADGLKITATGDDAAILLPPFAEGKRFILQVIIDSPVDSGIQLFYMVRGQKDYSEAKAPICPLTKGKNTIYLKVEDGNVIDPLRLDPSFKPGEYTINSITARAIPAPVTS